MRDKPERMCVVCGMAARVERGEVGPTCPAPDACTFDMTEHEAFMHWRQLAHDRRAERDAARAEVERLRKKVVLRAKLDELEAQSQDDASSLAYSGGTRVWLSGGINNPRSHERTVVTVYGQLSDDHRKRLMDLACEIDRAALTTKGGA